MISHTIVIYGAQLLASTIYVALRSTYGTCVKCFIVSDRAGNPESIDGIPVMTLMDYQKTGYREQILIATPEEYHQTIATELSSIGFLSYLCVTSDLRNQILEEYYQGSTEFVTLSAAKETYSLINVDTLSDKVINNNTSNDEEDFFIRIYMASSSKDRKLSKVYKLPKWIKKIQVGAILDKERKEMFHDDAGENISIKNPDYCELTALYWIWRNNNHEYSGLCHYRRMFHLTDQDIHTIQNMKPDVILPYPTIHFPNIRNQYKRYITKEEWSLLHEAVLHNSPEMKARWEEIWESQYFYNYNMLIAKSEVLQNFCRWMFDVLSLVEKMCKDRNIQTSPRYAGYMGEILTTIYFLYYHDKMKVLHIGVDLLQ